MARRRLDQVDAMRPIKQAGVVSTHSILYFAPAAASVGSGAALLLLHVLVDALREACEAALPRSDGSADHLCRPRENHGAQRDEDRESLPYRRSAQGAQGLWRDLLYRGLRACPGIPRISRSPAPSSPAAGSCAPPLPPSD